MAGFGKGRPRQVQSGDQCALLLHQYAVDDNWSVRIFESNPYLWLSANLDSTLARLNDESLHTSLKQSRLLCTKSSATQISELIEIKSRLEENNALAKVAASETRELSSRFDMYVGLDHHLCSLLTPRFRTYFKNLGADILLFMQKIW